MTGSTVGESQTVLGETQAPTAAAEEPDHRLFGVVLFLVAESAIFLGFFGAYLIYYSTMPQWPPQGTPELELALPAVNTAILVASSFVMHRGQSAIKADDLSGLRFWFGLTGLLGAIFLGGQLYEYATVEFGLTANLFTSAFFVLTGFHGLHVTFGLLLIALVLVRTQRPGHYSSQHHFGVEAAELYWHFVDVVWIVLFGLVYLL
ncbi:MAG: heme-copper oxidase subunit III [Cyanobacteria bacterium QS_8_64_29]|nr:MAG: heme-copper oxidase subunit III [Cyanobacteria bacterium QS_8_64_29]